MRGYFGVAIYHPQKSVNIGTLWRTSNILGASFLTTIGRKYQHQCSDTLKTIRHIPLFNYENFEEFRKSLPVNCSLVGIEINDLALDLKNFKHPERACYLLGAEDTGIPLHILKKCNYIVQLQGKYCLNVAVAGSIVLYHRAYLGSGEAIAFL